MDFRFPTQQERVTIIGRTGSGKTQKAGWLLSRANFDVQPWIVFDYKHDSLLNDIPGIQEISFDELPVLPGLYIIHPHPEQEEMVDNMLWEIWKRENIGVFFDEAYLTPSYRKYHGYNALLMQGRSKNIPVYSCTQKPSWISPYVFSECDYFSVFHLNTRGDQRRVEEFTPFDLKTPLTEYHSLWYDVKRNKKFIVKPVPDRDTILSDFENRLAQIKENSKTKRRFF